MSHKRMDVFTLKIDDHIRNRLKPPDRISDIPCIEQSPTLITREFVWYFSHHISG
jgi:hypothetical protein